MSNSESGGWSPNGCGGMMERSSRRNRYRQQLGGLIRGAVMINATLADIERFMSYVDKLPSGCWFWTGARSRGKGNRKWYGSFRVGRVVVRAHRFSCEVLGGRHCPPQHDRDHTCFFSLCVNPSHIEVVHKVINQQRKMARKNQ